MLVQLKHFFRQSIIGGLVVLLPLVILGFFFRWVFEFVTNLISPLTNALIHYGHVPVFMADILVLVFIVVACFLIGTLVSTGFGKWLHNTFDKHLARLAPGYQMVKDIVNQFLGDSTQSPFANGEVAKVYIFGEQVPTYVTGLITSRHDDGCYTVFVPTGPNPTSGNIYHVLPAQVEILQDVGADKALRTIIGCGAGSGELFKPDQSRESLASPRGE